MKRFQAFFLAALVASGGLAYAAMGPTARGYTFNVSHTPSRLYLPDRHMDAADRYPSSGVVTIRVQNAQEQGVNGIPVMFQVEPECQPHVNFGPQQMMTAENGVAQATLTALDKIGFCDVTVTVDGMSEKVTFNITQRPAAAGGTFNR